MRVQPSPLERQVLAPRETERTLNRLHTEIKGYTFTEEPASKISSKTNRRVSSDKVDKVASAITANAEKGERRLPRAGLKRH
jgi:hypothetical protein